MKILICDDRPDLAEQWKSEIEATVGPDHAVARLLDPVKALQQLVDRRKLADKGEVFDPATPTELDGTDILVVDYDLIGIDENGNRPTGEGFAKLAQVYSPCRYVIVLNQFARVDFDLAMTGHLSSFADVNVSAELVGEPALWKAGTEQDFRPSVWTPTIPTVEARRAYLDENPDLLDRPILELLGLEPRELHGISDSAFAYLSTEVQQLDDLAGITLLQVVERVLGATEAAGLVASSREMAIAFGVSGLANWLDRAMLRPLDALIDTAHLIERRPYLLDATPEELADAEFRKALQDRGGRAFGREGPAGRASRRPSPAFGQGDVCHGTNRSHCGPRRDGRRLRLLDTSRRRFRRGQLAVPVAEYGAGVSRGLQQFQRSPVRRDGQADYGPQRRFAFGD